MEIPVSWDNNNNINNINNTSSSSVQVVPDKRVYAKGGVDLPPINNNKSKNNNKL